VEPSEAEHAAAADLMARLAAGPATEAAVPAPRQPAAIEQ
jgi:hypothetical protein